MGVALFLAIMATASRVEEGRQKTGAKIVFKYRYTKLIVHLNVIYKNDYAYKFLQFILYSICNYS